MVRVRCLIEKFEKMGEKTGWTYLAIDEKTSRSLNPGVKVSYPVKGSLDTTEIKGLNLLPMGNGDFILPLNASLRKSLRKKKGDYVEAQLELDKEGYSLNTEFIAALETDVMAYQNFKAMPRSHQNYYSKWIEQAKTSKTKMDRIVRAVISLARKEDYATMIRKGKET